MSGGMPENQRNVDNQFKAIWQGKGCLCAFGKRLVFREKLLSWRMLCGSQEPNLFVIGVDTSEQWKKTVDLFICCI